jgi:hypothetical protein
MAEAFAKTFKRDYVWSADLSDARSVMELLPKWFEDYNERAPIRGSKSSRLASSGGGRSNNNNKPASWSGLDGATPTELVPDLQGKY